MSEMVMSKEMMRKMKMAYVMGMKKAEKAGLGLEAQHEAGRKEMKKVAGKKVSAREKAMMKMVEKRNEGGG